MTTLATTRRVKRSFTLTPDVAAFVTETRLRERVKSDSEALVLMLRELMLEAKRRELDAAIKHYYDTASDQELAEQSEWAEMAGPNIFAGIPE
jgi:Arc/MetJ family transcription regulator